MTRLSHQSDAPIHQIGPAHLVHNASRSLMAAGWRVETAESSDVIITMGCGTSA